jgi:hypothetical protein
MTVLGLLLIAEPAHAQRLQWGDRTGDVWLENDRASTTNPGDWRGTADLIGPAFQPVPCGLSSRIDYSANTMRIGIPTACMKNPRWVKVRFGSIHSFFHAMKIYLDDAASPEVGSLAWSPRIRRG